MVRIRMWIQTLKYVKKKYSTFKIFILTYSGNGKIIRGDLIREGIILKLILDLL